MQSFSDVASVAYCFSTVTTIKTVIGAFSDEVRQQWWLHMKEAEVSRSIPAQGSMRRTEPLLEMGLYEYTSNSHPQSLLHSFISAQVHDRNITLGTVSMSKKFFQALIFICVPRFNKNLTVMTGHTMKQVGSDKKVFLRKTNSNSMTQIFCCKHPTKFTDRLPGWNMTFLVRYLP